MMLASKGPPVILCSSTLVILALIYFFSQRLHDRGSNYGSKSFCQVVHQDENVVVLEKSWSEGSPSTFLPNRGQSDVASSIDCVVRKGDAFSSTKWGPPESTNMYENLKKHAVNNTVMVVPVNKGMLQYAKNMVCSLRKINFDVQNMVFWTLDDEASEILRTLGLNTFHDPSMYGVADFVGVDGRDHFEHMMTERPKFFINVLSAGLDILFLDADIVFFDDPLAMRDPSVDLVIGSDGRDFFGPEHNPFEDQDSKGDAVPPVCAGSFWMKSSEHTIALWEVMKLVFQNDPSVKHLRGAGVSDDQHGFDVLLNQGRAKLVEPFPEGITADMMEGKNLDDAELRVKMMDQAFFPSGHLYLEVHEDYQRYLATLEEKGGKNMAIHFNWNGGSSTKIDGAKRMGLWYLDDDEQCK